MVFIVVFLNEGPLEKQHLLNGYPSQIYQIKSNQSYDSPSYKSYISILLQFCGIMKATWILSASQLIFDFDF